VELTEGKEFEKVWVAVMLKKRMKFDVQVTVQRDKFLFKKTRCTNLSNLFLE